MNTDTRRQAARLLAELDELEALTFITKNMKAKVLLEMENKDHKDRVEMSYKLDAISLLENTLLSEVFEYNNSFKENE